MMRNLFLAAILIVTNTICISQQYGSFKDPRDGRVYKTVKIGEQVWMAENLNTDRFRNGDPIFYGKTNQEWILAGQSKQAAFCYYQNDQSLKVKYGNIYNAYAIIDERGLCPNGYEIPQKKDYLPLLKYLGGDEVATYSKLKSKTGWTAFYNGANSSGFNLIPSGWRYENGVFHGSEFVASLMAFCDQNKDVWNFEVYDRMVSELDTGSVCESTPIEYGNGGSAIRCIKSSNNSNFKLEISIQQFTPVNYYPDWFEDCYWGIKEINLGSNLDTSTNTKHAALYNCKSRAWVFFIGGQEYTSKLISDQVSGHRLRVFRSGDFTIHTKTSLISGTGREAGLIYLYRGKNLLQSNEIVFEL